MANQKAADLAAGSAMMSTSPDGKLDTADHTHVCVLVADPRWRSRTKFLVLELQWVYTESANSTTLNALPKQLLGPNGDISC